MRAFVLCLVASCGVDDPPAVWTGEYPETIDVVVWGDNVQVHAPAPGSMLSQFAASGRCVESTDGGAEDSCLDRIVVDGEVGTWLHNPQASVRRPNARDLVIEGCGRRIEVALSPREVPTPSMITHERDAGNVTVAWTTDRPAASALVMVSTGYIAHTCHVSGSTHTFVLQEYFRVASTTVFTFTEPDAIDTPLGRIHVWYGAVAGSDDVY